MTVFKVTEGVWVPFFLIRLIIMVCLIVSGASYIADGVSYKAGEYSLLFYSACSFVLIGVWAFLYLGNLLFENKFPLKIAIPVFVAGFWWLTTVKAFNLGFTGYRLGWALTLLIVLGVGMIYDKRVFNYLGEEKPICPLIDRDDWRY